MRVTQLLLALCFTVSTVAAPSATAQVPDSLASTAGQKSALVAASLEYLVPTLGHAYAGDWRKGLPPLLVSVAGIAIAIESSDCNLDQGECGVFLAGLGTILGGRVCGIYSAARLARSHQANVDVGPQWEPQVQGPGLRVTWRW